MSNNTLLPRILIVEDSRSLSAFYKTVIVAKRTVEIKQAYTGKEALDYINSFAPDIILLDVCLPDISGLDILKTLQERHLGAITIVMTATESVDYAVEAMRLGAYDFMVKPIDANRLLTTIHNVLERLQLNALVDQMSGAKTEALDGFIGESPAMLEVYNKIRRIGNSKASVFITGESGTGKEVTAQALHNLNTVRTGRFVAINCASIPKELMESEIFGHVKGAFTGATSDRDGAVSQANGGTLFLDELCEMDLDLQSKFLRFIQSSKFQRVGSSKVEEVDVRIICATNRNPMEEVQKGRFREDLYYRLFVIPIHLPPLRERDRDVLLIAYKFLQHFAKQEHKKFTGIAPDAEKFLLRYSWPGNVRQLQNMIQRAIVLYDGTMLTRDMLPPENELAHFKHETNQGKSDSWNNEQRTNNVQSNLAFDAGITNFQQVVLKPEDIIKLEDVEKNYILVAISACQGSVIVAAHALGVNPSTLYRKLDKWLKDGTIAKNAGYTLLQ